MSNAHLQQAHHSAFTEGACEGLLCITDGEKCRDLKYRP